MAVPYGVLTLAALTRNAPQVQPIFNFLSQEGVSGTNMNQQLCLLKIDGFLAILFDGFCTEPYSIWLARFMVYFKLCLSLFITQNSI